LDSLIESYEEKIIKYVIQVILIFNHRQVERGEIENRIAYGKDLGIGEADDSR
jgi:hypothetical protein